MKPTLNICVSGAAGQICYSVLFRLAHGDAFGMDQPIHLKMLEVERNVKAAEGVGMELTDCAFPLLQGFTITSDLSVAFKDADYCLLFGAFPRMQGMERSDLLMKNKDIFVGQGKAIADYAKPTCRVLVIGNPANTNGLICALQTATKLPKHHVTSMTRLDHNRTIGQIAAKLGVLPGQVKNVVVLGNHSNTMIPFVDHAYVQYADGKRVSVREALRAQGAEAWIDETLIPCVRGRGTAIIEARGHSSSASAANAAIDHCRDWHLGTQEGEYVSVALMTEAGNSYGLEPELMYSLPCRCVGGEWQVVDLEVPEAIRAAMQASADELKAEKKVALGQ